MAEGTDGKAFPTVVGTGGADGCCVATGGKATGVVATSVAPA